MNIHQRSPQRAHSAHHAGPAHATAGQSAGASNSDRIAAMSATPVADEPSFVLSDDLAAEATTTAAPPAAPAAPPPAGVAPNVTAFASAPHITPSATISANGTTALSGPALVMGGRRIGGTTSTADSVTVEQDDAIVQARELSTVLGTHADRLEAQIVDTHDADTVARMRADIVRLRARQLELSNVRNDPNGESVVAQIGGEFGITPEAARVATGRSTTTSRGAGVVGGGLGVSQSSSETVTTHGQLAGSGLGVNPSSVDTTHRERSSSTVLGAGGLAHQEAESHSTSRADGSSDSTSSSRRGALGEAAGGIGSSGSSSDTRAHTAADGTSTSSSHEQTGAFGVSRSGATLQQGSSDSHTERDAEGRVTRGVSTSQQSSSGVVWGQQGRGVTSSATQSASVTEGEQTRAGSISRSASVTDRGAAANGSAQGSLTQGPANASGRFGAGGSFTADVRLVPDTSPPEYELVTTLSLQVSLGASGGLRGEAAGVSVGASVGLTGSASRQLTYRHRMPREEASRYLAQLRATSSGGAAPSGSPPEFGVMARARAMADQGHAMTDTDVLSDPASASAMSSGSSLELTTVTSAGVEGSVEASGHGMGGGVSGSRGATYTRTMRVGGITEDGRRLVEITMSFAEEHTDSAAGHAQLDGVGAQAAGSETTSDGRTVVFHLDPRAAGYDARYQRVLAAGSPDRARRLAEELGAEITEESGSSDSLSGGVGALHEGAVRDGVVASSAHSESTSVTRGAADEHGRRNLHGTSRGSSSQGLGVRIRGRDVATATDTTTATSTVREDGSQEVDVTETRSTSVVAPVVPQFLADLLRVTTEEMNAWHIDDHALAGLTGRASNRDLWASLLDGALRIGPTYDAWLALGRALVNPRPEASWVATDPVAANKIARGRAIVHFIRSVGAEQGQACIGCGLRSREAGEELGVHVQFPEAIGGMGSRYDAVRARIEGAAERYRGFSGSGRDAAIDGDAAGIRAELHTIFAAVEGCREYRDDGARIETMGEIRSELARIDAVARRAKAHNPAARPSPRASAPAAAQGPAAAAPAPEPAAPAVAAPEPEAGPTPEELEAQRREEMAEHRRRLGDLVEQVMGYKAVERENMHNSQIWTGRGRTTENAANAVEQLDRIAALYPAWVRALHEAFHLVDVVHGDASDLWRNVPNVNFAVTLLHEAQDRAAPGFYAGVMDVQGRAARWYAAARL